MIAGAALSLAAAIGPAAAPFCPPEVVEAERIYSGVYLDEFESQRFFEGARDLSEIDRRAAPRVWIVVDPSGMRQPFGIQRRTDATAYRIRFVGTRRSRGIDEIPCGYGHMNYFAAEVRAIELLTIEPLVP